MTKDIKLIDVGELPEPKEIPAGSFSAWLRRTRVAQMTQRTAEVPCAECNACCRSSYFIHIGPDETQTLARIPKALLFPAPGLPKGNVVMGYDENGHCPMLIENKCSIYDERPRTCRSYDCRVFPAAGIAAGEADKAPINLRIRRWRFSYPGQRDRADHASVQAAAAFLREHAGRFPDRSIPKNPAQLAMLAIKVHEFFIPREREGTGPPSDLELVESITAALRSSSTP